MDFYKIETFPAISYNWFYVRVYYNNKRIAEKTCCKNPIRAAKSAKKQIKKHMKAREIVPEYA